MDGRQYSMLYSSGRPSYIMRLSQYADTAALKTRNHGSINALSWFHLGLDNFRKIPKVFGARRSFTCASTMCM